jgi:hypothetical protein
VKKFFWGPALFILILAPVFGEHEFSLGFAPVLELPAGAERFGPGMGAGASLDWLFWDFGADKTIAGKFGLGISATGGFSSLSVEDGSVFSLLKGSAGPFIRWRPFDRWTFRFDLLGGVYQYQWNGKSNSRASLGGALAADFHLTPFISLFARAGYTQYAFAENPINALNAEAGIRLNIGEIMNGRSRLRGEKIEQRRVFPVSYTWYRDNPVATVRITNDEPNTITGLGFSLFMERYMGQPEAFASIASLAPGQSVELPVTALFNELMLDLTENINANGQILVSYRSLGMRKEAYFPVQMLVYHRNALSWDDDRRAASFVSPRDPSARLFARHVAQAVDLRNDETLDIPRNVQYAAALFEALAIYGINYVIDPNSSFIEMSDNASALDSLNYPYQTLYFRGGDCDDLAILFCSLLEVLGIETAFITTPGHIYMAFALGDSAWGDAAQIIEQDGKRWMPVEITVPGEGFFRAWRIGAREWRNSGEKRRLYPMRESWAVYPSVSVPAAGDRLPLLPEEAVFLRAFDREARLLGRR